MSDSDPATLYLDLTAKIVSAHVANNAVLPDALPELIQSVYRTLRAVEDGDMQPATAETLQPAVPVKRSVFPDYIVCLEDGKKLKMLKRHLQSSYGMTPEQYRAKWDLPATYPMVAPAYAAKRSSLAKESGLGYSRQKLRAASSVPAGAAGPDGEAPPAQAEVRKLGRPKGSKAKQPNARRASVPRTASAG